MLRYATLGFSLFIVSCSAKNSATTDSSVTFTSQLKSVSYSEDMRPVDGALSVVTLTQNAKGKYDLTYKTVSSGFMHAPETKEYVIGKDLICEFAPEVPVANCVRIVSEDPFFPEKAPALNIRYAKTAELSESNVILSNEALKILIDTPEIRELKDKIGIDKPVTEADLSYYGFLPNKNGDEKYFGAFHFRRFIKITQSN